MKFQCWFKTPDAISDGIHEAVDFDDTGKPRSDEEAAPFHQECYNATEKWIKYGECIMVEFDTETGTCTVVPEEEW